MVSSVVLPLPQGHTPSKKAYNNQLTYMRWFFIIKLDKVMIITNFMAHCVMTRRQIVTPDRTMVAAVGILQSQGHTPGKKTCNNQQA